jgi:glycosyltransferase involved in cell wall biosynthesis
MAGFANTGQSTSARVLLKAEIQQATPLRAIGQFGMLSANLISSIAIDFKPSVSRAQIYARISKVIHAPYTLFSRIPIYVDKDGSLFAEDLWRKDLELHLDYIDDFRLCCPVLPLALAPEGASAINGLSLSQVISIRKDYGWVSVVKNLVPNFYKVAVALRKTRIAHSGGAGWAFPLTFYILMLRPFFQFQWIVIIESSFWMKPKGKRASIRELLSHHIHSKLLGAALRRADARIFTQRGYQTFFDIENERSLIAPATWVDEERIISRDARQKQVEALGVDEIRLLFPARMIPDKGPDIVMRAIEIIDEKWGRDEALPYISIDLIGDGPMADKCRRFVERHSGPVNLRFLDPVPYGEPFFDLLGRYHAIILANKQDEQPRVVFDAFSQGVTVISSDTAGVQDVTTANENALLFPINDAEALASHLILFAKDKNLRSNLTNAAHAASFGKTHSEMHRNRSEFLKKVLQTDC